MKRKRVLLAHDNDFILIGVEQSLERFYRVAGRVRDSASLPDEAKKTRPDLIISGLFGRAEDSLRHLRQTRQSLADVKIILLATQEELRYAREALELGVSALLLSTASPDELRAAIKETLGGRTYVEPRVSHAVLSDVLGHPEGAGTSADGVTITGGVTITARQRNILRLLAEGLTAKEIAHRLGTSKKNIDYHKSRLMRLLDVRNGAELVRYALENDMV